MKLVAILHDIRSVHNVGSVFRTADGAGAEKLYLCGITPAPFDRLRNLRADFAKVALGAERYVPWESVKDTGAAIGALKKEGYEILALEQSPRSIPYYEALGREGGTHAERKIAILIGAEVEGLPADLLASADRIIEIPMRGAFARDLGHPKRNGYGKESLNVSVAFGIAMFGMRLFGDDPAYNKGTWTAKKE